MYTVQQDCFASCNATTELSIFAQVGLLTQQLTRIEKFTYREKNPLTAGKWVSVKCEPCHASMSLLYVISVTLGDSQET